MAKQKVSIVVLGENHCDPLTGYLTKHLINQCLERDLNMRICLEYTGGGFDNADLVELLQDHVQYNTKILERYGLIPKKLPNLRKAIVTTQDIAECFIRNGQKITSSVQIFTYCTNLNLTSLISAFQYALSNNIEVIEIDRKNPERTIEEIEKAEQERIKTMISKMQSSLDFLSTTSGVMLVICGSAHARRLSANLILATSNIENAAFEVKPIVSFSEYSSAICGINTYRELQEIQMETLRVLGDSADVLSIMSKIEYKISADALELEDGTIMSKAFNELAEQSVKFASDMPRTYYIPNMNTEKVRLIESISGTVVNEANGEVCILSSSLTKSYRDVLGISRNMLTLEDYPNQMLALSTVPNITIEKQSGRKALVTYPDSAKEQVTEIATHWKEESVQAKYKS